MIIQVMQARKKKLALLKMVPKLISGANALTMYILTPTGGVYPPIVVTTVKIIEYHMGSKPRAIPSGKKMGIVSTKKPRASIIQPPSRYMNNTTAKIT